MYTLPDLPYNYNALEPYIDEATMQIHHDKHHKAYVDNLNAALGDTKQFDNITVEQLLGKLDTLPESIRTKVRNHGGGHANHSLFWQTLAPLEMAGGKEPDGELAYAITKTFGNFSKFQEAFSASALGRFGSGWAWLSLEKNTLNIEDSPNQDSPLMAGRVPLLGLDVWEHAYYLNYQNRRKDYIDAWWHVINWKEVERRFHDARK